jgi:hypothetical protein
MSEDRKYDTLVPNRIVIDSKTGLDARFLLVHTAVGYVPGEDPEGAVVLRSVPKAHPLFKLAEKFARELTDVVAQEMWLNPIPEEEPEELATADELFPQEGADGG